LLAKVSGKPIGHFKSPAVHFLSDCMTLEDGTDRLSANVRKQPLGNFLCFVDRPSLNKFRQ